MTKRSEAEAALAQCRKARIFSRALFGDLAREAMLACYVADADARSLSIDVLSNTLDNPLSNTERWLRELAARGLIEVRQPSHNNDKKIIALTQQGRHLVENILI